MKKIVVIADTHGMHKEVEVPEGDILVHAGDVTSDGSFKSFADFMKWFKDLPHKHKIFIGGNHDMVLDKQYSTVEGLIDASGCVYLQDHFCEISGLDIWGSPMTPLFNDWFFM